jgi:MoxR-like ATPase
MKAESDRIRIERYKAAEKAAKEKSERVKAEAAAKAVAPTATSKRSPSQVAAAASKPYDSSAPVSIFNPISYAVECHTNHMRFWSVP